MLLMGPSFSSLPDEPPQAHMNGRLPASTWRMAGKGQVYHVAVEF